MTDDKKTVRINDTNTVCFGEKLSKQHNRELVEMVRSRGKMNIFVTTPEGQVTLRLVACGNKYQAVIENWQDGQRLHEKYAGQEFAFSLIESV
jgi:hypothetical protein